MQKLYENLDKIITKRICFAKGRAKATGKDFDLNFDYMIDLYNNQEGKCFYSGIKMLLKTGDKKYCLSIDRINSALGYIKGNVVLCCSVVNTMKMDLSTEEFIEIVGKIYTNQENAS